MQLLTSYREKIRCVPY